jgi:hypothetical protein
MGYMMDNNANSRVRDSILIHIIKKVINGIIHVSNN